MPVIREQRQYQVGPIGVARIYEGSATGEAIARGADRLASQFYQIAAQDAERQGLEMAQAIGREQVIGIDPETGAPMALSQMEGMGRIGSEAYRRVIQTRFQQSIDEEIQNQSRLFAEQYSDSPDGPTLYQTAMSDYLSSMSANATGQWQTYIQDTGTSYIANATTTMQVNALRRQRAAAAAAARRAAAQADDAIELAAASYGLAAFARGEGDAPQSFVRADNSAPLPFEPQSFGAINFESARAASTSSLAQRVGLVSPSAYQVDTSRTGLGEHVRAQSAASAVDLHDSGIMEAQDLSGMSFRHQLAASRGLIQYHVRSINLDHPDAEYYLTSLRSAFGRQDMEAVARLAPELAPVASILASSPDAMRDFESFTDNLLGDYVTQANANGDRIRARRAEAQNQTEATLRVGSPLNAARMRSQAFQSPALELPGIAASLVQTITATRRNIADPEISDGLRRAYEEREQMLTENFLEGAIGNLTRGRNQEDIMFFQRAFAEQNPRGLGAEERAIYDSILSVSSIVPGVFDDVRTTLSAIAETSGRANQILDRESQNSRLLETLSIVGNLRGSGETFAAAAGPVIERINSFTLIDDGLRRAAIRDVHIQGAYQNAYAAFEGLNAQQVTLAANAMRTGEGYQGLPAETMEAIQEARRYVSMTGQDSLYETIANRASTVRTNELNLQAEVDANNARIQQVANGLGNPREEPDRVFADEFLLRGFQQFAPEIRELPADLYLNPAYIEDQNISRLLAGSYATPNFMPQLMYETARSVAAGAVTDISQIDTFLNHWSNVRTRQTDAGPILNPAIEGISAENRATLDYLLAARSVFGSDEAGIATALRESAAMRNESDWESSVTRMLGQPVDQALLSIDGYASLGRDEQRAVRAYLSATASGIAATPNASRNPSAILNQVENMIGEIYPDSGGVVMGFEYNGAPTSRTQYALERTVPGREQDFMRYALEEVARLTDSRASGFAGGRVIDWSAARLTDRGTAISRGDLPEDSRLVLIHRGYDDRNGHIYAVAEYDLGTRTIRALQRNDNGDYLYIGTNEPFFAAPSWINQIEGITAERIRAEDIVDRPRRMEEAAGAAMP